MSDLSDTQIRSDLRSLLIEAGVDADEAALMCTSGIVRLLGEIVAAREDQQVQASQVGELERSMRRSRGVKRVHFNVRNWERTPTGDWEPIATEPPQGTGGPEQPEEGLEDAGRPWMRRRIPGARPR